PSKTVCGAKGDGRCRSASVTGDDARARRASTPAAGAVSGRGVTELVGAIRAVDWHYPLGGVVLARTQAGGDVARGSGDRDLWSHHEFATSLDKPQVGADDLAKLTSFLPGPRCLRTILLKCRLARFR